jgi:hypothetical protein
VQHTGLDKAQVYQHLRTLQRLQLVEQRRPVTSSPTSLKTNYAILDGYLNFYFAFVEPFVSRLRSRTEAERHLRQTVMPKLDQFVSRPAWEYICQDYMRVQEPDARTVGAWWGSVPVAPRRNAQRELDAVALDADGKVIATASCKWTNAQLDYSEETLLTQLEAFVPGGDDVRRHYFFSRSGFSDSLHAAANSEPDRVRLVAPDDLYR